MKIFVQIAKNNTLTSKASPECAQWHRTAPESATLGPGGRRQCPQSRGVRGGADSAPPEARCQGAGRWSLAQVQWQILRRDNPRSLSSWEHDNSRLFICWFKTNCKLGETTGCAVAVHLAYYTNFNYIKLQIFWKQEFPRNREDCLCCCKHSCEKEER